MSNKNKIETITVEADTAPIEEIPCEAVGLRKCHIINLEDRCVDGKAIPTDANERGSVVLADNENGTYNVGYEDTQVYYGTVLATNIELL